MLQLTGAQALVRLLRAEQVHHVFGVVGGKLAPLLHAISQEPGLRYTGLRHEANGPLMAAAVNAGSGQLAVAIGEMGPGGLNLASGVGTALANNLPLLLVTSNQHRAAAYPHRGMFMDLDTLAMMKPLVKWNAVVHDGRRMPELVRCAFRAARTGRPGPVHLDVPQDVLAGISDFASDEFEVPAARYRAAGRVRPSRTDVDAAAALLRGARRPLIVAGGGVVQSGADVLLRSLAERLQAPLLPSQMALGVVGSDSPFFIGQGGLIGGDAIQAAFERADVVLAVGCRFSSWMWDDHGPLVRRHQQLININIDPQALGQPALHAVAMHADAGLAVEDLLEALGTLSNNGGDADWLSGLRALRIAYEQRLAALAADRGAVMHPAALAQAIAKALPAESLVVYDGGHTTFWSNDYTPVSAVRTRFHDPGMSQLGFGLPYALALQLLSPGVPVINITGDGAFGFTLQELDTARRLKLPVINIIHNNAAWGIIRAGQRTQFEFELGTSLAETDYAAIARGFGCHGETVDAPEDLAAALARATASGLPAVIDCHTRFEPHPAMAAFGRMNRYGYGSPA